MYVREYVENDVLSVGSLELVCLLYSKAIEKLNQARHDLRAGSLPETTKAIGRVMEIVGELQGSLDQEKGGEIAANLAHLYGYIQERLAEALARQRREPLDEAVLLLGVLYEGWNECKNNCHVEDVPRPVQDAPMETVPVRSWTL